MNSFTREFNISQLRYIDTLYIYMLKYDCIIERQMFAPMHKIEIDIHYKWFL